MTACGCRSRRGDGSRGSGGRRRWVRSTVRSLLFPDLRPGYAGYVGWRGAGDRSSAASLREALGGSSPTTSVIARTSLAYEIPDPETRDGRSMNWVWYRTSPRSAARGAPHRPRGSARLSLPPGAARAEHVRALLAAVLATPSGSRARDRGAVRAGDRRHRGAVDGGRPGLHRRRRGLALVRTSRPARRRRPPTRAHSPTPCARPTGRSMPHSAGGTDQLELGRCATRRTREVGERAQVTGSFEPETDGRVRTPHAEGRQLPRRAARWLRRRVSPPYQSTPRERSGPDRADVRVGNDSSRPAGPLSRTPPHGAAGLRRWWSFTQTSPCDDRPRPAAPVRRPGPDRRPESVRRVVGSGGRHRLVVERHDDCHGTEDLFPRTSCRS